MYNKIQYGYVQDTDYVIQCKDLEDLIEQINLMDVIIYVTLNL